MVYLIPTYISIGFMVYNLFNDGFFFYINDMNEYFRGTGVTISIAVIYAFFIGTIIYFYRYKHLISGRIVQGIIIFFFTPIIGSIIQVFAYGTTLGTPFYTLAVFIVFLMLEKDRMSRDSLTKLYTRSSLESRLQYKLKTGEAFTIIMADLNGFKKINDTYGHSEGDRVLQKVAEIIRLNTYAEDMVGRYGGDEFLLLIEYKKDIGREIICRIDNALIKYNEQDCDYKVHLSYGYKFVENPSESLWKDYCIMLIEICMRIKRKGKQSYVMCKSVNQNKDQNINLPLVVLGNCPYDFNNQHYY